ncbi:hypothetical protein [Brevibacillus sp. BC25]|uniref:hypothetical protein n=1 Tax=Brevibacillus sp. BC25 TaxID=1144308 RepID=UPI000270DD5B|nr:hypothetical protein [Brevibacillus sp. BC25]EJL31780.1 hypothetical protein PMI05_00545 [Brevibacillus sp. BC25]
MHDVKLIEEGCAEMDGLVSVIGGEIAFNPADYKKLRGLAATLKRQDDETLALYGRKLYEWYRQVEKFAELRKRYPLHARPVRKTLDAAMKAAETLERLHERIEMNVYRKAGELYGV